MLLIFLKNKKDRKIKNNYPWIFEDEIKNIEGDRKEGEICNVFSSDSQFLGKGIYSKGNISVKMLSIKDQEIDERFFESKILTAYKKRESLKTDSYRLIHAEADGLPGVLIDKYKEFLVIQIRNKGMELYKNYITNALIKILKPKGIYERSDFETTVNEDIKRNVGTIYGETPPDEIIIKEHKINYYVDIKKGQKTGFFFDQRDSRKFLQTLTKNGDRVLDAYTYTGGFAFNAAVSGAEEVIAIDKDEHSYQTGIKNAELNKIKNVKFINTDFLKYIENYEGEKFDIIILDPPSLIKKKSERQKGIGIFKKIIEQSAPHLKENGIMGVCSCAYQADIDFLIEATRKAYEPLQKTIQVLGMTYQSLDHPWIIQIPESLYLKCLWFRI
ncbi:class I SAM-dependent rRNA methyltransferase [Oceanotoga teriensis]|jgi:23S rRNA (cytosine1962-C5)-methyltransferase|uniref:SAM-dependent methyltransferase n=1 Tax=Oceanotoga teriensis TaxID=515440 RepID=A0AA45HK40_9BACT|nr:class I SAM-dependent rRNA methyltransferase [Oceanotoga teriensis]MDO7975375.1 class I SAM-dependent rRNA methyltransferase [Oceanotoga teriensis]PWJ96707.1 SAM-dependent methyltransferase [Oceanotoga teriensis]